MLIGLYAWCLGLISCLGLVSLFISLFMVFMAYSLSRNVYACYIAVAHALLGEVLIGLGEQTMINCV